MLARGANKSRERGVRLLTMTVTGVCSISAARAEPVIIISRTGARNLILAQSGDYDREGE